MPAAGEGLPPILVLGGTLEGRLLAEALWLGRRPVITTLAGVTSAPGDLPGEVHRGGFGGAAGLLRFLRERRIAAMVDATHPFAVRISARAAAAAAAAGLPHLRLERPRWSPRPGDRWQEADDLGAALPVLAGLGSRVLVAAGSRILRHLPEDARFSWWVRSIEQPAVVPCHVRWIEARPPFRLEDEVCLLRGLRVEAILAKDSGGEGSRAKLDAARALGLPVVLLRRPAPPPGVPLVASVEAALDWLACTTSR